VKTSFFFIDFLQPQCLRKRPLARLQNNLPLFLKCEIKNGFKIGHLAKKKGVGMLRLLCFCLTMTALCCVSELFAAEVGSAQRFEKLRYFYLAPDQLRIPDEQPCCSGRIEIGIISLSEKPYKFIGVLLYHWAIDEIRDFLAAKPHDGDPVIEVDFQLLSDKMERISPESLRSETIEYVSPIHRSGRHMCGEIFRWMDRSEIEDPNLFYPAEIQDSAVVAESESTFNGLIVAVANISLLLKSTFVYQTDLQYRVVMRVAEKDHAVRRLKLMEYHLGRLSVFALALAQNARGLYFLISRPDLLYPETDCVRTQAWRRLLPPPGLDTYDASALVLVRHKARL
jgi:hypothetical protein